MRLLTILCLVLLSVHSYSQEVVTGPFLIRGDIYYHQDTNEPVTGIIEELHENGQLWMRSNFIDDEPDGLWEDFDEEGNLIRTGTFRNGEEVSPPDLSESFWSNGQLKTRVTYKDGKQECLRDGDISQPSPTTVLARK